MEQTLAPLLSGFCCIAFVLLAGIAVIALIVFNQKRSKQKAVIDTSWLTVDGRITSTKLDVDDDADVISPVVAFEYTVNEQVYTSSQVVGRPNSLKSKALKTLELYPLETEILVHYDPSNPKKARVSLR